jgi:molecular chaperone GrpE
VSGEGRRSPTDHHLDQTANGSSVPTPEAELPGAAPASGESRAAEGSQATTDQPEQGARDEAEGSAPEGAEEGQLAQLRRERDEYLDALRRLQADFENYKKRMIRQQTDQLTRAAEALVEKLLPVLDTADLAVHHGSEDAVVQLRAALSDALGREGLERIDPVGELFDPNVADAVAHEPDEEGSGPTVAEVLRPGYRWKGRVIRPAMVKVRG